MSGKNFGNLEKLVPIYVLNGAHVVLALDAQRVIENLQFKLLQLKEECTNYKNILEIPLPTNVITLRKVK